MADSFLTGVLAVAVASPHGAIHGRLHGALTATLPAAQALAVFAAWAWELALPYLAASLWPAVARALPPGAWMDTFRRFLAFPMFATVVWLVWVLGQQSGIDGAASLLILLVGLGLLAWSLAWQGRGGAGWAAWPRWPWFCCCGLWPHVTRMAEVATVPANATATAAQGWQPWAPAPQRPWWPAAARCLWTSPPRGA